MNRQQTKSSFVQSIGYDEASRVLEVELPGKRVYRYFDVGPEVYDALISAESIGRLYNDVKKMFKFELVVEKEECLHERLDEDGICRQCGEDRRGIGG